VLVYFSVKRRRTEFSELNVSYDHHITVQPQKLQQLYVIYI
jgi:hypothetical protein